MDSLKKISLCYDQVSTRHTDPYRQSDAPYHIYHKTLSVTYRLPHAANSLTHIFGGLLLQCAQALRQNYWSADSVIMGC